MYGVGSRSSSCVSSWYVENDVFDIDTERAVLTHAGAYSNNLHDGGRKWNIGVLPPRS
jgi:hypothetical protein